MAEFIIKTSAGIAISYLLYFFFLKNNTRLVWIRIFFLVSIAASFLVPVLGDVWATNQKVWVQIPQEYYGRFLNNAVATGDVTAAVQQQSSTLPLSTIALLVYFAGMALVLMRFFIGLIHLLYLIVKHKVRKVDSDKLVVVPNLPYPFSFLHLIFIDAQTVADTNKKAIFQHERVHVKQWHSVDLIVLELLVAAQWFNPFAWLFRRSVKELHEFLADQEVVKNHQSPLEYKLQLFNMACGAGIYLPVNGFKSSLTKKRILMITNNKNTRWIAAFTAIVVVIIAIQTFSRISIAQDPPKKQARDTAVFDMPPPPPPPAPLEASANIPTPPPPPYTPLFKGTSAVTESNEAFGDYITKNIRLPEEYKSMKNGNQGKKEPVALGIFIVVTLDENGKVVDAEKGFFPERYRDKNGKLPEYVGSPRLENAIIDVVKTAPDFKLPTEMKHNRVKINYDMSFDGSRVKVNPESYSFE
jgi:hypothetical protein